MDTKEVDRHTGEGNADAYEGVDGVAVEGHCHQEHGAHAEHHGVQQRQLGGGSRGGKTSNCGLILMKCLIQMFVNKEAGTGVFNVQVGCTYR